MNPPKIRIQAKGKTISEIKAAPASSPQPIEEKRTGTREAGTTIEEKRTGTKEAGTTKVVEFPQIRTEKQIPLQAKPFQKSVSQPVKEKEIDEEEKERFRSTIHQQLFGDSPKFTGIFPDFDRTDGEYVSFDNSQVTSSPRKRDVEDSDMLDLGPIYEEKEEKPARDVFSPRSSTWGNTAKKRIGALKMAGSMIGAIVLGSAFGYFLLTMLVSSGWFMEDLSKDSGKTAVTEPSKTTEVIPADEVEFDLGQGGAEAIGAGSLLVSDRTFYAIQGGVFKEKASGDAAIEAMAKQGIPTLLIQDDAVRLFLGIAYKREDALDLAGYFKDKVPEIYLKEYRIPGGTVVFPGTDEKQMKALNDFFTHGTYLLEKTAAWTGDGVAGKAKISQDDWNKFRETHRRFLEEAQQVRAFLPEGQKKWVDHMSANINKAMDGMVKYLKDAQVSYLIQSQQALLNYFNGYREFLKGAGLPVTPAN